MNILSKEEFYRKIRGSHIPVLVDFYSDSCGPCRMMSPLIGEMAQNSGEYTVYKVNVDMLPELADEFNVANIPTFTVIKNGKEVARHVGMTGRSTLERLITS